MSEFHSYGPEAAVRHTPDPRQVRFAMSGLVLLGMCVGLLGAVLPLWSFELSLDAVNAGRAFLALAGGAAAGAIVASWILSGHPLRAHRTFRYSAWTAAAGLVAVSLAPGAAMLAYPLAALGLGIGGVIRTTAAALEGALTYKRASGLMHLAGVAFGFGAVGVCVAAWALNNWVGSARLLWGVALVFAALGWFSGIRVKAPEQAPPKAAAWRSVLTPIGGLLGAGLLLQAANFGAVGGWLGLYVFRKLGVTIDTSLAILALFWLAVTSGRVAAARLPVATRRMRVATGVTMTAVLGAAFLLNTVDASGAIVGALLLGAAVGAAHPLTLGAVTQRFAFEQQGVVRLFTVGSLVAGLGFAWLMAPLSIAWGIDVVVWSAVFCNVASLIALTLIVLETRLSQHPAEAR